MAFLDPGSARRAIGPILRLSRAPVLRQLAVTGLVSLLPRAVAILRDLLLAWRLGVSAELDLWLTVTLLAVPVGIALAQSSGNAMVPAYLAARRGGPDEPASLAGWASLLLLALGVVLGVLLAFGKPLGLGWLAPSIGQAQLERIGVLLPIVACTVPLVGLGGLWTALGNSGGRFALSAAWPAVGAGVAAVAIAFAERDRLLWWLAVASLVGAGIETLLQGLTARAMGVRLRLGARPPGLRAASEQTLALFGAALVLAAGPMLDQAVAAGLPSGSLSAFQLGSRVPIGAAILVAVPLGQVLVARFARLGAKDGTRAMGQAALGWAWGCLAVGGLLALPMILGSEAVVRAIFQRGAFDPGSTPLVASVQALVAGQLPLYLASIVLSRALGAGGAGQALLRIAAINLGVRVVLDLGGAWAFGLQGLAAATTVAAGLMVLQLAFGVRRMVTGGPPRPADTAR